jgi:VanZ family protein
MMTPAVLSSRRLLLGLFWAYGLFLTTATHAPADAVGRLLLLPRFGEIQADKMNHLVAYAVLALLGVAAFTDSRSFSGRGPLLVFFGLVGWAFLDEITQPLFGRNADITDWIYDVLGLACGCVVGWLCLRIVSSRLSVSR